MFIQDTIKFNKIRKICLEKDETEVGVMTFHLKDL